MENEELSSEVNALQAGRSVIKRYTVGLQGTPGVYRMLDKNGGVLYVGKAKNLRNRAKPIFPANHKNSLAVYEPVNRNAARNQVRSSLSVTDK